MSTDKNSWEKSVELGKELEDSIRETSKEGDDPSRTFTYKDLEENRYEFAPLEKPNDILEELSWVFKKFELSELKDPSTSVVVSHAYPPHDNAQFCQVINKKLGTIVAYANQSPCEFVNDIGGPEALPKLKYWSDVAYLQWVGDDSSHDKSQLQYVIQTKIDDKETMNIIGKALGKAITGTAKFTTTTFEKSTDQFCALLGSPKGRDVGYLLKRHKHKKELGHKEAVSVSVYWDPKDEPALCFKIEDVK